MIEINGIEYRNLEEQVQKNKEDIEVLQDGGGSIDLRGYATEEYVDNAIENIDVDLTGYATETYVGDTVENALNNVPTPTEDTQAANKAYVDANAGGGGGASPFDIEYNFGAKNDPAEFTDEDKSIIADAIYRYLTSSNETDKVNFQFYGTQDSGTGIAPCKWWIDTTNNKFYLSVVDAWDWYRFNSYDENTTSHKMYCVFCFEYTYDSGTDVVTIGTITRKWLTPSSIQLDNIATPRRDTQAANKAYVDSTVENALNNVPTPVTDTMAANKAYVDAHSGGGGGGSESLFDIEYNFGAKASASDFTDEDKAVIAEAISKYVHYYDETGRVNIQFYATKNSHTGIAPCKWWVDTEAKKFYLAVHDMWDWPAWQNRNINTPFYWYYAFVFDYTFDLSTNVTTIDNIYSTWLKPDKVGLDGLYINAVADNMPNAVLPKNYYEPTKCTITLKTYNTGSVESTPTVSNAHWYPVDRKLIIFGSGLTLTNDNGAGDAYIGLTINSIQNTNIVSTPWTKSLMNGLIIGQPDGGTGETYAILAPNIAAWIAQGTEYVIRPLGTNNIDGTSNFTMVLQFYI